MTVEDSIFTNNSSPLLAGVFLAQERAKLKIINCYIKSNHAIDASMLLAFELFSNSVEIINTTFEMNFGSTTMFDLSDSSILMQNCTLINNTNPTIYLIQTTLEIYNLTFVNNTCNSLSLGCLISSNYYSTLIMHNAIFFNLQSKKTQIGAIMALNSTVQMQNVSFSSIKSLGLGTCIYSQYTDLKINNSNFSDFFPSCIYIYGGNMTFNGVSISNSAVEYSPLYISDIEEMDIETSKFCNVYGANKGGGLLIDRTINSNISKAIIKNVLFYNNSADTDGGAIFIASQYVQLINSTFEQNKANRGGSIFFDSPSDADLVLNNVNFKSNTAFLEGGAITSTSKLPVFNFSVECSNNSALYGKDYGSYPIRMVFQIFEFQNSLTSLNN